MHAAEGPQTPEGRSSGVRLAYGERRRRGVGCSSCFIRPNATQSVSLPNATSLCQQYSSSCKYKRIRPTETPRSTTKSNQSRCLPCVWRETATRDKTGRVGAGDGAWRSRGIRTAALVEAVFCALSLKKENTYNPKEVWIILVHKGGMGGRHAFSV